MQILVVERVLNIAFVLERLRAEATQLDGRIDTERVAVIGHSNGGLAAAETCRRLDTLRACANLDGQAAGGPFSTEPDGGAPEQPFLFLTKETSLHPELDERFDAAAGNAHRVVVPAASHDHFGDGALFEPTLNPMARTVDRVAENSRSVVAAFLDIHLRGAPQRTLDGIRTATDVYVNVYPSVTGLRCRCSRGPSLPPGPDAGARSVAAQRRAAASMLTLYRRLLELRRASPALRRGRQQVLPAPE